LFRLGRDLIGMNELRFPTNPSEAVLLIRTLYANRVVRFLTVGGVCGLIQLTILHTLVAAGGVEVHIANLIAFVISMELNFVLHQLFTWRDRLSPTLRRRRLLGRMAIFNISATTTLIINQGTFALFNLFIWYLPAAAIGICVAAVANFMLNDRVVFRLWSSSGTSAKIAQP
jgi:putative flippase GtrA